MNNINKINFFKTQSKKGLIFDIALTGISLAIVIAFQALEAFMPYIGDSFKFNFSLVFIFLIWIICGYPWACFLLVARFVIAPSLSPFGYTSIGIYASFLLLFSELFFIVIFISSYLIMKNMIKNEYWFIVILLVVSVIITSIILTILNGLWMTPVFWWLFGVGNGSYSSAREIYNTSPKEHTLLFFMPTYWSGIFLIFFTGNILKFSSISLILFSLIKIVKYVI